MRTAGELISRGNNLLVCGFVAVVGLAALPELSTEGLKGTLDEGGMVLLGVAAVAWFLRNRYRSTWLALSFPILLMVLKVVALVIEDPDDRGDDIGMLITAAILAIAWSAIKARSSASVDAPVLAPTTRS
jgi:hypothetical protein